MTQVPESPEVCIARIRRVVAQKGLVTRKTLLLIETALMRFPKSAPLWCLRGDLIQLSDDDNLYSLNDAAESYVKASEFDPTNPEPLESLGHFYDAVMDDPARAEPYFRQALALGAGRSAQEGLAQVLDQLKLGPNV